MNPTDMFRSFERGGTFWVGVVVVIAGIVRIAQIGVSREMASRRPPRLNDDKEEDDNEKDEEDDDDSLSDNEESLEEKKTK